MSWRCWACRCSSPRRRWPPALRAGRLSAAEAIGSGRIRHAGRALRLQRWLGGTKLPRPVSLGLGLPFARPARSIMTMAAVVLGVTSMTFALGLGDSVTAYEDAENRTGAVQVEVNVPPEAFGLPAPLSDAADESLLRASPGAVHVAASADLTVRQVGSTEHTRMRFYRGDVADLGYQVLHGTWPDRPGQVAVSPRLLVQRGLAVGDTLTMEFDGRQAPVRIVADVVLDTPDLVIAGWPTLASFAPGTRADSYEV
jgi:putative ABC transport system permease protein